MRKKCMAIVLGLILSCTGLTAQDKVEKANKKEQNTVQNEQKPRTLSDYVEQEGEFWEYLKKNHPIFKYEKEGRLVGKYKLSNREEEFVDFGGGKTIREKTGQQVAITYRLGMESILDYPNKFVGPEKCGECHPVQYAQWKRSRHSMMFRFPNELTEADGNTKKPMFGSQSTILPDGIEDDDVFAIIGTPRTKYGFLDKWLVRGTYHVEDGKLSDLSGKLVAGGNQFSVLWSKYITPEMAKKIAKFSPGFPTKLEDFKGSSSQVWGTNSYGSSYRTNMLFQPATSYCETCHSFKFDFKSKDEFFAALGNSQELRKHTISKGVSCEECHGAGAHLYGARGAGMPSNCERCHQRFAWNEADSKLNPRKPFNVYFKSSCPSCGTEGSQMYSSAHYDKGMRCSTCHDPHEVTANNWQDNYTRVGLKKKCQDCHDTQATFFKQGGTHAKDDCTSCHMPTMMSCENFGSIQNPDKAGFDNVRMAHVWKISTEKDAKSLNPAPGKPREGGTKGWSWARNSEGRFFIDLMWSCGRTSFEDPNLMEPGKGGCHSPVQSTLPDNLKFTNQEMIYDLVVKWQNPIKAGYEEISQSIKQIDKALAKHTKLSIEQKAQVINYTKQAKDILSRIEKDGSWGLHGPQYSKKLVDEALIYTKSAQKILDDN